MDLPKETTIVTIYDMNGRLRMQQRGQGLTKIETTLPPGIYLLKTNKGTQRIVIQ
jgi:hypothetical protein